MDDQPLFEPLSRREREILSLLGENLTDREIADRLFVALPTVKWYNRQSFSKLGVKNRREAVKRAGALGLLAQNGADEPAPAKHNLPSQLTPFVGRSRELAEIDGWLAHPHTRLLTILAPGGMGKTRLALEAAERNLSLYTDGVFFAPLAALTSPDHVVPALAEALGLQFTPDGRTPGQQLADFLRRKHLLLVIDNFEHLLDAAPLITDLLTAAPKVTALVTSRERLNLSGEVVYPLAGLHYPDADTNEPLRYGAAELFIECALRADAHFVVKDAAAIGRLCRRVQGMPLAIELAAALAGALSVDEIDAEVARSADFLSTTMVNVPERQRSVRAVFEAAWARLDGDARQAFRRMSVFRGGCTREAAQAVTGANIRTLAALVDKALLWRDPQSGRYDIHELLRQYAEMELECADETEAAKQAHQEYYAARTKEWNFWFMNYKQLEAIAAFDADIENIRTAFMRAALRGVPHEVEPFTDIFFYFDKRGWWTETIVLYKLACDRLESEDSVALGNALTGLSTAYMRFYMQDIYADLSRRGMEMLRRLNAREYLPFAMLMYAGGVARNGDWQTAEKILWAAMPIAEAENPAVAGQLYQNLGVHLLFGGKNPQQSLIYHQEAYKRFAERKNYWAMCHALFSFGMIALRTGDLDEAEQHFTQALSLAESIKFQLNIDENHIGLSRVALEKGDWKSAHLLTQELKRNRLRSGFPQHWIFEYDTTLAFTAVKLGKTGEAKNYLSETISLYDQLVLPLIFDRWLIAAGNYFAYQNDFIHTALLVARVNPETADQDLLNVEKQLYADLLVQCRAALSPEEFDAAWARGQTLTNEEAIALVAEALR